MLISRLYELEAGRGQPRGGAPNYPGRRTTGSSPRDPAANQQLQTPPRPSSLPLPARESADHRLSQKPGRSSRPPTPAAATVPAATPVPEPNLPGPNQNADLTPAAATCTASRRPPHQDRDRGAGDGAGARPAGGCP